MNVNFSKSLSCVFGFVIVLAATANGREIHCGGVDCENLRIRCRGAEPCYVSIFHDTDIYYVTSTHEPSGQGSMEVVTVDRIVNVSVRTGPGDDVISFTSALVEGNLRIDTGGGNDGVAVEDGLLGGHTRIDTGAGNDTIFFHGGPGISGPLRVTTGKNDDYVAMNVGPPLGSDDSKLFDGGAGTDTILLTVIAPLHPPTVKRFETVGPD
jgi:hypothetical protein